jgi:DNA-binding response OmpR family regulator
VWCPDDRRASAAITILVVEDERKTADTIQRYLEHAGYEVVVCSDGAEALNEAASGRYELVVLDLALPALDGTEICRALRASGLQVPIIMLTAPRPRTIACAASISVPTIM